MENNLTGTVYWPLVVYFIAVITIAGSMIGLSYILGERHKERATGEPYESGITSTGSAHLRFSIKFYRVAMFFVIFDVESIFIISWAIAFREAGWAGYLSVLTFIVVLAAILFYLWRCGGLDWGGSRRLDNVKRKGYTSGRAGRSGYE